MTKLVKSDKFFAFEYTSRQGTAEGEANASTGNRSIAGIAFAFQTKEKRSTWIDLRPAHDYVSNGRTATTVPKLRQLCLGLTVNQFNDYVLSIEDELKE